jgi:hypothetical protein
MTLETKFDGDDLCKIDPKFRGKRFRQYLAAVGELMSTLIIHNLMCTPFAAKSTTGAEPIGPSFVTPNVTRERSWALRWP